MATETERKFLVAVRPDWLGDCESERIEQGYIAHDGDVEVRVRRIDGSAVLTIKGGHGLSRSEVEIALGDDQLDSLWPLTEGRRLAKRRFRHREDAGTFEIDVYEAELDGLITAEIEFDSEQASRELPVPGWVEAELTGDERYSNYELATSGIPAGVR